MTLNTLSVDKQLSKADPRWVSGWASTASLLTTERRQSVFICLCARFMRFLTRMNEGMNFTCSAYCIRNSCNCVFVKKNNCGVFRHAGCTRHARIFNLFYCSYFAPPPPVRILIVSGPCQNILYLLETFLWW
jgi:hypothetical protein